MTGPARKRQKRDDYRKAQEAATTNNGSVALPKKKFYRQRAHANPFSDHSLVYPASPSEIDWSTHYPAFKQPDSTALTRDVEIADIGCGFGGLIVSLSPLMPDTLMLGMELRLQVTAYVTSKIAALRSQNPIPSTHATENTNNENNNNNNNPNTINNNGTTNVNKSVITPPYHNISALRTNTMKFLPNYFRRAQLSHIFLCFPDPHFKQRKHKARIVSAQLCSEYAYVLRPGGCVYTITDVEELHEWIVAHFVGPDAGDGRVLWERVQEDVGEGEGGLRANERECVRVMKEGTEEGKKVTRNGGRKFVAVFRRRGDPDWPEE